MTYDMQEALTRFDLILMSINKTISDMLQETGLEYTISREQMEALIIIRTCSQVTVNELAEKQGIFKTAASKRINKLEKLGLVKRAPSDNKRIKLMQMTEEGTRFLEEVKYKLSSVVEQSLHGIFTTAEINDFVDKLEDIEKALKERKRYIHD
ncbi:MarR family winged helix-turn-helix transcriptional regulator [Staphylococcus debuckii]|uniref:MarR family transcriptional regulator n=1 Tax=Staphylococcus debuckii TaxID=2044912 RepID=A0ABU9EWL4_9STAP|nr:MarR family transcriptional regulator [Staphylococcus debuckii]AYU54271.1 MarR family transcriptional regulator [Staphylococcus debuckii]